MPQPPVLVTGATGYIGGRLVPRLLRAGERVRVIGRSREKLMARAWARAPEVELVACDALDREALRHAARGCRAVYYLIHSMDPAHTDFVDADRLAARNMVYATANEGVDRIIYLGGLGSGEVDWSRHLRSRAEVERILHTGPATVTALRAGIVLGSGSASFEMLRYLVERLPLMLTSTRIFTRTQPIAIRNVLHYLLRVLLEPSTRGRSFDIGGPEVLTYRRLIDIYAEAARLRPRWVVPLRSMTPGVAAQIIQWITPIPPSLAKPLSRGLGTEVIVRDGGAIRGIIPQRLLSCREAIKLALARVEEHAIETSWMDAGGQRPPEWTRRHDAPYAGGDIRETCHRVLLRGTPEQVWEPIRRLGGDQGWYYADWLWKTRGLMDQMVGGYGVRRGRRHPTEIRAGDALDWWRVIAAEPGRRLLLLAEMKLPGEAILEFRLRRVSAAAATAEATTSTATASSEEVLAGPTAADTGAAQGAREEVTELVQIARFLPRGLSGLAYWYSVYPLHAMIFSGMLREIARRAGATIVAGPEAIREPSRSLR
jgi:uncharacterized protein YbjT (DUF2867 family)